MTARILLFLLALVAVPGAGRAQVFEPTSFFLDNGMQVVVVENRRAPIVTHMVWYRAGAADEPPGKSGIAHFLEHLMFKATRSMAAGEFSRTVARNGGRDNAFTSWDYTAYHQSVARDRLGLVMRMEADRMTNLVLTDEVVATERDVILEERRQVVENVPGARLREQVAAALFLNHPYGRPIIGWEHEIRGLGRADAEAWYRRWYAPNNAVLVVAGDVSPDEVRRLAEQHYGPIPRRDVPERVRPAEPVPQAARRVTLRDERVRQPSLTRAYLAPSARRGESQHVPALEVLADIASGQAGRFHRALVLERQLATSVSVSYNPDSFDLSTFSFGVAVHPGVAIEDVERALDEEIAAMLREGVAEDEVERTKARVRDSTVLSRDALGTAPRAIGADLMTGATIEEIESWPRRIGAVTAAQVAAAARAVLLEERGVTGFLLPRPRT